MVQKRAILDFVSGQTSQEIGNPFDWNLVRRSFSGDIDEDFEWTTPDRLQNL